MKYIYIIGILLICAFCHAQDYFSKIIPTVDNPLVEKVKKVGDQYIISTDFFSFDGVQGGLIIVSDQDDEKVKFDNMDLSSDPILITEDVTYFLGENPFREGDSTFFISKVDNSNYEQQWYREYTIEHPQMNPRAILMNNDNIYVVNLEIKATQGNYPHETSIYAFDFDGNLENIWKYNTDNRSSFAWNSFISSDKSIMVSSLISFVQPGTYGQILKINQQGEIIWNYEGTERLDNGAVPTWAIELSDSTILQTYYVDRNSDAEYIANNWYPRPNKFIWLSKDGEYIKDKTIITDKQDFLFYYGLKKGDGDYFYAYGYYEDRRPAIYDQFYAYLTKFSNEGDTIWSRNYQHPSYPDGNVTHNIKDIIEEENGDITILADITPPAAKTEIWLFKVNSEGCYVNEECEDMTVITSTEDPISNHQKIYPNPTSGMIHLEWHTKIKEVRLTDITGKIMMQKSINSTNAEIDIALFHSGIYILLIRDESETVTAKKIIKL